MQLDYSFPKNLDRFFKSRRRSIAIEIRKRPLIIIVLSISAVLLFILNILLAPHPPVRTVLIGLEALSEAKKAQAEEYAPKLFQQADQNWQLTMKLWRQENKKWRLRRDYLPVLQAAELMRLQANQAKIRSQQKQDSLAGAVHVAGLLLKERINEFRQQYADLPFDHQLRRRFAETELMLNESESALKNNHYLRASVLIQESEAKLGVVDQQVTAYLDAYLRQLPQWRRWTEETIAWSKENSTFALVVNKLERKLYVYENGKAGIEFPVEFGPNWIGHKKQRGDGRTPEGQYHIRKKKESQQTAYFLALEIDYPNEGDQREFERAQLQGEISSNAHIGGLIEIHGQGGRGINWTEGCVALKNEDMKKLFNIAQVGTPVTIVGSLNGLKKNALRAKK